MINTTNQHGKHPENNPVDKEQLLPKNKEEVILSPETEEVLDTAQEALIDELQVVAEHKKIEEAGTSEPVEYLANEVSVDYDKVADEIFAFGDVLPNYKNKASALYDQIEGIQEQINNMHQHIAGMSGFKTQEETDKYQELWGKHNELQKAFNELKRKK